MAEAMYLRKPVIATGYSGNLDFMDQSNSYLVPYEMVPVAAGEYPEHSGQVWADADVAACVPIMRTLVENPSLGMHRGAVAERTVLQSVGYRVTGQRYLTLLAQTR
jgi:hypothetical protein